MIKVVAILNDVRDNIISAVPLNCFYNFNKYTIVAFSECDILDANKKCFLVEGDNFNIDIISFNELKGSNVESAFDLADFNEDLMDFISDLSKNNKYVFMYDKPMFVPSFLKETSIYNRFLFNVELSVPVKFDNTITSNIWVDCSYLSTQFYSLIQCCRIFYWDDSHNLQFQILDFKSLYLPPRFVYFLMEEEDNRHRSYVSIIEYLISEQIKFFNYRVSHCEFLNKADTEKVFGIVEKYQVKWGRALLRNTNFSIENITFDGLDNEQYPRVVDIDFIFDDFTPTTYTDKFKSILITHYIIDCKNKLLMNARSDGLLYRWKISCINSSINGFVSIYIKSDSFILHFDFQDDTYVDDIMLGMNEFLLLKTAIDDDNYLLLSKFILQKRLSDLGRADKVLNTMCGLSNVSVYKYDFYIKNIIHSDFERYF